MIALLRTAWRSASTAATRARSACTCSAASRRVSSALCSAASRSRGSSPGVSSSAADGASARRRSRQAPCPRWLPSGVGAKPSGISSSSSKPRPRCSRSHHSPCQTAGPWPFSKSSQGCSTCIPMRSSKGKPKRAPAERDHSPGPWKVSSSIPSGASTRASSASHRAQESVRCVNTDTASTRSTDPAASGSGGSSPQVNARTARLRCTQATLGSWMSQPISSQRSASACRWRSVRPGPQPKSSTRRPSQLQSSGSRRSIVVRQRAPISSKFAASSRTPTRARSSRGGIGGASMTAIYSIRCPSARTSSGAPPSCSSG